MYAYRDYVKQDLHLNNVYVYILNIYFSSYKLNQRIKP